MATVLPDEEYELRLVEYQDFTERYRWRAQGSTTFDPLTGYTARGQIRQRPGTSTNTVLDSYLSIGSDPSGDYVELAIPGADIAGILPGNREGRYDVFLCVGTDPHERLLYGRVLIERATTRLA